MSRIIRNTATFSNFEKVPGSCNPQWKITWQIQRNSCKTSWVTLVTRSLFFPSSGAGEGREEKRLKMKLKVGNNRINVKEVLLLKISIDGQFHSFHRACVVSDLSWFQYTMRFPICRELMLCLLAKTLTRVSQARHLLSPPQVLPWITVTALNLDRLVWSTESPEAMRAVEMKEQD